jgi:hypothetical protein
MRKFNDDNNDRVIPEDVRIQIAGIRNVLFRAVTAMQTKDVGNMLDKLSQVIDTVGEQKDLLQDLEELQELEEDDEEDEEWAAEMRREAMMLHGPEAGDY